MHSCAGIKERLCENPAPLTQNYVAIYCHEYPQPAQFAFEVMPPYLFEQRQVWKYFGALWDGKCQKCTTIATW